MPWIVLFPLLFSFIFFFSFLFLLFSFFSFLFLLSNFFPSHLSPFPPLLLLGSTEHGNVGIYLFLEDVLEHGVPKPVDAMRSCTQTFFVYLQVQNHQGFND